MSEWLLAVGTAGLHIARCVAAEACTGLLPFRSLTVLALAAPADEPAFARLSDFIDRYAAAQAAVPEDVKPFAARLTLERLPLAAEAPAADSPLLRALGAETPGRRIQLTQAEAFLSGALPRLTALTAPGDRLTVCAEAADALGGAVLRLLPERLPGVICDALVRMPDRDGEDITPETLILRAAHLLPALHYRRLTAVGLPEEDWRLPDGDRLSFTEWLLAQAFVCPADPEASGVFVCQLPRGQAGWDALGASGMQIAAAWSRLSLAAACLSTTLAPALLQRCEGKNRGIARGFAPDHGWFRGFTPAAPDYWTDWSRDLKALLQVLSLCFAGMAEVLESLPAGLQRNAADSEQMAQAGTAYRALLEGQTKLSRLEAQRRHMEETDGGFVQRTAAQVSELDRITDDAEDQADEVADLQNAWLRAAARLDNTEKLRLLRRMRSRLRFAIREENRRAEAGRELVDRAEAYPEEQRNLDAIDAAAAHAAGLESHLEWLRTELSFLQAELQEAEKHRDAARTGAHPAEIPANDFFSGDALRLLVRVTGESAQAKKLRGPLEKTLPLLIPGKTLPQSAGLLKSLTKAARAGTDDPALQLMHDLFDAAEGVTLS